MSPITILNLFANIGGNRTLWRNCRVTALEIDKEKAEIYQQRFPDDRVIIADVYEWIADHIDDGWDFIWASPPCKTHSRLNVTGQNIRLPDLRLYELILFFQHFAHCKWVVENVIPYYEPLIKPKIQLNRHNFWCNFPIQPKRFPTQPSRELKGLKTFLGITETITREMARDCCHPSIGQYIYQQAFNQKSLEVVR